MSLFLLVLSCIAVTSHTARTDLDKKWTNFKTSYQKEYRSAEEEKWRRLVWADNVDYINKHNNGFQNGIYSFSLGENEYTDMTHEEFVKKMASSLIHRQRQFVNSKQSPETSSLPAEVDWRAKGWVGPVGNQGPCGSCWAFTATGALEGQHKNKTGTFIALSNQQLMDCSQSRGNHGCEGGLMDNSFMYIKDVGGIQSDKDYPYTGKEGKCKFNKTLVVATDTGFQDLPHSEESLMRAVAEVGPISAAVDASQRSFQLYKSGVYDEPHCKNAPQHSLVVTGYGTLNNKKFWAAKNSWGTSWGDQGYILMSRDKGNQCGIANTCSYPTM